MKVELKWSLIICFFCVTAGAGHWAEAEVIGNHPLIAQQHQWQEIWQIPAKYFSFWAARFGQGYPWPQVWTLALCSVSWDFTCSWWQVARIGRCKLELGGTKANIYLTWYIDKWGTSLCIILHSLSLEYNVTEMWSKNNEVRASQMPCTSNPIVSRIVVLLLLQLKKTAPSVQ